MSDATNTPLLEVRGLTKHFPVGGRGILGRAAKVLRAVDGIDFDLERGQCLGLVGESGCGKSTVARTVIGLHPATSGSVRLAGAELMTLTRRKWLPYRRRIQMIFQDPYASLDPRQTVASILTEPARIHKLHRPKERKLRAMELLEAVGLNPRHINRYPHEFSGGQRQRIGIARALALEPDILICDEPVSALDVSIQAQIINLLGELKERFDLAYLFIAHDLAVVRHISDSVAVMYLGRIVELATRDTIFSAPRHPYTQALLSAVPVPDPIEERARERIVLRGDVPSPLDPPPGCAFEPRCHRVDEVPGGHCRGERPEAVEIAGEGGHLSACHLTSAEAEPS